MQRAIIIAIIAVIIIVLVAVAYKAIAHPVVQSTPSRKYSFYANQDSYGNDITNNTALAGNISALQITCDKTPGCVAFNTGGYFKNAVVPKGQWYNYRAGDATQGIYVLEGTQI